MTALVWDEVGKRTYEIGVDHGVLYLDDVVVPWNGLINVEESPNAEAKSFYLEGVKYLVSVSPSDYIGKLKAFTYPEEFDAVNGIAHVAPGLSYYDQPPKSFSLSYRTKIGNDLEGEDFGYRIHILYNIFATPDPISFSTIDSSLKPIQFGWNLTGTPPKMDSVRPTVHISIDSRSTPPEILQLVEDKLYGTSSSAPSLPLITEINEYFGYLGALLIIDHGDGTWSALDESDNYINMLDDTTFEIVGADTVTLDPDTYEISSTNIGESV